ncbi:cellulase (glycosyl hydrolase family 5) [Thermosporothrix hazakensis]|jgi:hypothetical protein|uniref:Cellulase (Glycosyl hydrolase family 5) n=2 Tax=Thermosporothrix TaxID=768650 RepID=A0A326U4K1_THEHA|nr:cellulase family glycosylhydrolase [Thermosporothrix hazakensis]PZW26292.1 cellulase (glycosyl hydrolase family 5) [Thermosporothrix hazakensis]BBH90704.1 hypothetical protein KTC_54550 [Thermosporothrix sp. COM3]GCE48755.1 hypothetical protein KTH_36240 [Thermosporothrix hazakensis]
MSVAHALLRVVLVLGCVLPVFAAGEAHAETMTPYEALARGPYTILGNQVLDASGKPYLFHGITRSGPELDCTGKQSPYDRSHLALMGVPVPNVADIKDGRYWGGNTVRVPLSQNFWLKGDMKISTCTAAGYRAFVHRLVDDLTALGLNVILNLHWSGAGGQVGGAGAEQQMPDTDAVPFWEQVAQTYKDYSNVLFELYDEPGISYQQGSCWKFGCMIVGDEVRVHYCGCFKLFSYQAVGMQTLLETIRKTGARNLVIANGTNGGYSLKQLSMYALEGTNVLYSSHPSNNASDKMPSFWTDHFGQFADRYPLLITAFGQYNCKADFVNMLFDYLDARQIGWIARAWFVSSTSRSTICAYPQLVTDYNGTPSHAMGESVYERLRDYHADALVRWKLAVSEMRSFKKSTR